MRRQLQLLQLRQLRHTGRTHRRLCQPRPGAAGGACRVAQAAAAATRRWPQARAPVACWLRLLACQLATGPCWWLRAGSASASPWACPWGGGAGQHSHQHGSPPSPAPPGCTAARIPASLPAWWPRVPAGTRGPHQAGLAGMPRPTARSAAQAPCRTATAGPGHARACGTAGRGQALVAVRHGLAAPGSGYRPGHARACGTAGRGRGSHAWLASQACGTARQYCPTQGRQPGPSARGGRGPTSGSTGRLAARRPPPYVPQARVAEAWARQAVVRPYQYCYPPAGSPGPPARWRPGHAGQYWQRLPQASASGSPATPMGVPMGWPAGRCRGLRCAGPYACRPP